VSSESVGLLGDRLKNRDLHHQHNFMSHRLKPSVSCRSWQFFHASTVPESTQLLSPYRYFVSNIVSPLESVDPTTGSHKAACFHKSRDV
jgi:hypothetical protein